MIIERQLLPGDKIPQEKLAEDLGISRTPPLINALKFLDHDRAVRHRRLFPGHGFSAGLGMALAGKLRKKDYHVWVVIGDGESQEGSIWEATMAAPKWKLDNLTVILDRNHL
jgi:thiamine pyrophosphate-dependent acetolactate synthase large subunit-like protein